MGVRGAKRGANYVTLVVLIAIAIVAVALVASIVLNISKRSAERIGASDAYVKFSVPSPVELGDGVVRITVQRDGGGGAITGFHIILKDAGGKSVVAKERIEIAPWESGALEFSYNTRGLGQIVEITLVPFTQTQSGEEVPHTEGTLTLRVSEHPFVYRSLKGIRHLPASASAATAVAVEINITFNAAECGGTVEEALPQGWSASNIQGVGNGVWSSIDNKIRWAPIDGPLCGSSQNNYLLSYTATPSTAQPGQQVFSGVFSVDGIDYTIGGDTELSVS